MSLLAYVDDCIREIRQPKPPSMTQDEQADFEECLEERSAIMEYEGGLPRGEAELQARVICLTEYRNRKGIKA
ncbi:MAG: hypothetical protein RLZZ422_1504 [Pseudomonadota bacterium]|jgi:hypothetical protein